MASNRSVLVVDDNQDAADSLALLVETFSHYLDVAYDGPSAIEKAHNVRPMSCSATLSFPE